MKVYTCTQARRNLSKVLDDASREDILIRRGGETFRVTAELRKGSPLDIKGIKTQATTEDILSAIKEVRER